MVLDILQIEPYELWSKELLPVHVWNKQIKGEERGKTPVDSDWTQKRYKPGTHLKWVKSGLNIGFKIGERDLVIDIDPRNFHGADTYTMVADLLGYFDFDDLVESGDYPIVSTGGGGHHIYGQLPRGVSYKTLKEVCKDLPGVEFKRKGRQVLTAGSRHPSGEYYKWLDLPKVLKMRTILTFPDELIKRIKRENGVQEYGERNAAGLRMGVGCLTPQQLYDLILSKLDIDEYDSNDKWYPVLAGSHFATNGAGIEEFVKWSLSGINTKYDNDENKIRNRWESLTTDKDDVVSIGTLINELDSNGADSRDVRTILAFNTRETPAYMNVEGFQDSDEWDQALDEVLDDFEDNDNDDSFDDFGLDDEINDSNRNHRRGAEFDDGFENLDKETSKPKKKQSNEIIDEVAEFEKELTKDIIKMTNEADLDEITNSPRGTYSQANQKPGAALAAIKACGKNVSPEEKMKLIRMINSADMIESIEAQELLISRRIMSQGGINRRLKSLQADIIDSMVETIANSTINNIFNDGKHIIVEPNSSLYIYAKTHWIQITDEYLGKLIFRVVDNFKKRLSLGRDEITIVNGVVKTIRMRASTRDSELFKHDRVKNIINCKNGELHIDRNGNFKFKRHSYKSYLHSCLDIYFDPLADCPIFHHTLDGIFGLFPDKHDMIRHIWEILGYSITPYKNIAAWFLFRGPGGDGKSTIIKVLTKALGDAMHKTGQSILSMYSTGANVHTSAALIGKLSVVIEELTKGYKLNDAGLKVLSESSKMSANPKWANEFSFTFTANLIMCANFNPRIADTSQAIMRRANIIPFNREFERHGIDNPKLVDSVVNSREEMSGVLNSMLSGLKRVIERGRFKAPQSCQEAKDLWFMNTSPVIRFIHKRLTKIEEGKCGGTSLEVYQAYLEFCHDDGLKPLGRNNFYEELGTNKVNIALGHQKRKYIYGYKVNPDFDAFDDIVESRASGINDFDDHEVNDKDNLIDDW